MDPIEFGGQRSKVKVTIDIYRFKLVNIIETKPLCFFIKLGRCISHSEKKDPVDFGGQRSKVNVTINLYGNKLVNMIETKPLCASSSNLADILAIVRGWTLFICRSSLTNVGCAGMLRFALLYFIC